MKKILLSGMILSSIYAVNVACADQISCPAVITNPSACFPGGSGKCELPDWKLYSKGGFYANKNLQPTASELYSGTFFLSRVQYLGQKPSIVCTYLTEEFNPATKLYPGQQYYPASTSNPPRLLSTAATYLLHDKDGKPIKVLAPNDPLPELKDGEYLTVANSGYSSYKVTVMFSKPIADPNNISFDETNWPGANQDKTKTHACNKTNNPIAPMPDSDLEAKSESIAADCLIKG